MGQWPQPRAESRGPRAEDSRRGVFRGGVVREVVEFLVKCQGYWPVVLERYPR